MKILFYSSIDAWWLQFWKFRAGEKFSLKKFFHLKLSRKTFLENFFPNFFLAVLFKKFFF